MLSTSLTASSQLADLDAELHNRPYIDISEPARLSHIALLTGEATDSVERAHITELCNRYGVRPPPDGAAHYSVQLGKFRLRWERHTEFSTYTFIVEGAFDSPFAKAAIAVVPQDWLSKVPGQVIAATHIAIEATGTEPHDADDLDIWFEGHRRVGSQVMGEAADLWTSLRAHGDSFNRMLVRNRALSPSGLSRLVQRLIEIDTYRMMALLSLPVARETAPELSEIERELAEITARMPQLTDADSMRTMLDDIFRLAARLERRIAETAYRFGAGRAYAAIVADRLRELRESRLPGLQPLQQFLERRFEPARRTCLSVETRLSQLSERIGRAADLLRTRVDLQVQQQNQQLLTSMNRRAELQVRLQETVEGLSVVAISYYGVSLLAYIMKAVVPDEQVKYALAGLAPVVVAIAWLTARSVRKRLQKNI
ncbi:MAG: DUF3422 family protein [Geminicoccaceae bacterium]